MVKNKKLHIVHLYPKEMNIYGDNGNILVVKKRLEWRGIEARVSDIEVGEELPSDADIIISGGGQDKGQITVASDLAKKKNVLHAMAKDGVVMLLVCGTYQLFGHRFLTAKNGAVQGISVFDAETVAGEERLIGNITISTRYGELVGYENHSGNTFLYNQQKPFGTVIRGEGNSAADNTEGAHIFNVFGTYLHGPLLPKNPSFADEMIRLALKRKYGEVRLEALDDTLAVSAAKIAKSRPR